MQVAALYIYGHVFETVCPHNHGFLQLNDATQYIL